MNKGLAILIVIVLVFIVALLFYLSQKDKGEPSELKLTKRGNMKLTSSAFENNQMISQKYTCDGEDVNPPLGISEVPEGAQSLVLIVDDPDAPAGTWDHWIVWNINPSIATIEENSVPEGALQGMNDFGKQAYGGPCPPSGTHHYHFKLYALDTELELDSSSKKEDVEKAMKGHILEEAGLIGLYIRGVDR